MILRWAIWDYDDSAVEMLNHSIGTFRAYFGDSARYVVCTNDPVNLPEKLLFPAEVMAFSLDPESLYMERRGGAWRKWAPIPRLDFTDYEIRIDADIFLLKEPVELKEFCQGNGTQFIVTTEEFDAVWQYGNYLDQLPPNFVHINAGLVGQAPYADLSDGLYEAFKWWQDKLPEDQIHSHDEQGAIALVLESFAALDQVTYLPTETYRVVCPLNEPPVESTDGITLMHATYPDHPAFYEFKREIAKIAGI
jgi:hypothetical protein